MRRKEEKRSCLAWPKNVRRYTYLNATLFCSSNVFFVSNKIGFDSSFGLFQSSADPHLRAFVRSSPFYLEISHSLRGVYSGYITSFTYMGYRFWEKGITFKSPRITRIILNYNHVVKRLLIFTCI